MNYNNINYYELLGVDENASIDSIREARDRIKSINPDNLFLNNILDEAFSTLTNSELRKNYDELLNNMSEIDADMKTYEPSSSIETENPNLDVEENDIQKQYDILLGNYQKAISKVKTINDNNLNLEEKDYSEWDTSLQAAYRAYDEFTDFCKKNNKNTGVNTVDEILNLYNISKDIPNTQTISRDYYEILNLDKTADIDSIDAKVYGILGNLKNARDVNYIYNIRKIYKTLSDPNLRKKYDESLGKDIVEKNAAIGIYEQKHSNNDLSEKIFEKLEKFENLIKLEKLYRDSVYNKIIGLYDDEIDESMKKGLEKYGSNLPKKIEDFVNELENAIDLDEQIEKLYEELNIKRRIKGINTIVLELHENKQELIRKNLKTAKENYEQTLEKIKQFYFKEDFNENDIEWDKLLLSALNYYFEVNVNSDKLGIKIDVINSDKFLELLKQNKRLINNYDKAISKIIAINDKNLNSEEKDYSEWKPSLQAAYRSYDELVDFCKKNNINKDFESVDEKLAKYNISKEIPKNEKSKPVDLNKNKNKSSESNISENPGIYEGIKYIQTNKLNDNNYEAVKESYEFNQKTSRIKATVIGAALGFVILASPIGGFTGLLGAAIIGAGTFYSGKLSNFITKKIQSKQKFTLTKESYIGKITEINTIESKKINRANEILKQEIEELASHPNNNYKLELLKLKYLNKLDILNQIIDVRKNSISKKGGLTADSLKIAALKQEYRQAKHDLDVINKRIERKELENNEYAQDLNLNSIRYKNLTIGNMFLKRDIKKMKFKILKEKFYEYIKEEENAKMR